MAPLPENNTPVLFLDYTSGGARHTAQVRLPLGTEAAGAVTAAAAMRAVMIPLIHTTDSYLGARFRLAGSNVSFPIASAAGAGTSAFTLDPELKPNFRSWTGRSIDGRDVKFTLFSPGLDLANVGYRDNTPSTAENNVVDALESADVNARSISGLAVLWNGYVNYGSNAYFQRKARRT